MGAAVASEGTSVSGFKVSLGASRDGAAAGLIVVPEVTFRTSCTGSSGSADGKAKALAGAGNLRFGGSMAATGWLLVSGFTIMTSRGTESLFSADWTRLGRGTNVGSTVGFGSCGWRSVWLEFEAAGGSETMGCGARD